MIKKYLITFCYFETDNSKINLKYFLKKGLIKSDEVFFIFIIKGLLSINIPEYENVKIIKTDNEGYDFGGYTDALNYVNINDYDFYIFLNDSVRGPFIPLYCDDPWYKYFTSKLSNDVILSGSTINSKPIGKDYIQCKHIQSCSFCLNKKGIGLLYKENFFDKEKLLSYDIKNKKSEKIRLINDYEIGMSKIILDNNYKIQSLLLSEYKDLKNSDIQYDLRYYDDNLNPFETIFVKTNRMKNKTIENYTFFFTNLFDNRLSFYKNYNFKSKKKNLNKLILFIFFSLIFINYFFINNPLINTINIFKNYFHFYKIRYFF